MDIKYLLYIESMEAQQLSLRPRTEKRRLAALVRASTAPVAALVRASTAPVAAPVAAPVGVTVATRATTVTRREKRRLKKEAKVVNIGDLNDDVSMLVQKEVAKNGIKMLTNETLEEFKRIIASCVTFKSMSAPAKLIRAEVNNSNSGSPPLDKCVLKETFKGLVAIKLVDMIIDIDAIRILKYALKYASIKTILLSNISFKDTNICGDFATLFNNVKGMASISTIECLILRKINFLVEEDTTARRRFNIFMNNIVKLKNLKEFDVSNFDINSLFFESDTDKSFAYMFVKLLIGLTKLEDLIFTNNIIYDNEYEYLFNNYYSDMQHCYVIKIINTKNENPLVPLEPLVGVYVKCNWVGRNVINENDPSDPPVDEYYMELIYMEDQAKRFNTVYYYSKGNKHSVDSKNNLSKFINEDFKGDRDYLIKTMMKIEGVNENSSYRVFKIV